jgi:glycosyltransferase involved in cell wall biosynthesis
LTKVLICIPWFHPAFRAGGPIQSIANLVKQFPGDSRFYIYCGNTDLNGISLTVPEGQWVDYYSNTKVWYAESGGRRKQLRSILNEVQPTILFCIGLYDLNFTIYPVLYSTAAKKIISVRGMLHPGALSQKSFKKKIYLLLMKSLGIPAKVVFHATDETEAEYIRQEMGNKVTIAIAGNYPAITKPLPVAAKMPGMINLLSIALISAMKNHLLVIEALQQVDILVEYKIYGPIKDANYWQQCKEAINKLPVNIKVQYEGELPPEKLEIPLLQSHVFILPSKSENFGHALLGALNAGRPVITSRFTPWNGLEAAQAGINSDLTAKAIKEAILFFGKMNQQEYDKSCTAAIAYAANTISTKEIDSSYSKLFALSSN